MASRTTAVTPEALSRQTPPQGLKEDGVLGGKIPGVQLLLQEGPGLPDHSVEGHENPQRLPVGGLRLVRGALDGAHRKGNAGQGGLVSGEVAAAQVLGQLFLLSRGVGLSRLGRSGLPPGGPGGLSGPLFRHVLGQLRRLKGLSGQDLEEEAQDVLAEELPAGTGAAAHRRAVPAPVHGHAVGRFSAAGALGPVDFPVLCPAAVREAALF